MTGANEKSEARRPGRLLAEILLVAAAAVVLLWNLGSPYLWQDEAATAVLAQRMLRFGRPLAYDGVNLITIDHYVAEDARTIEQRASDPRAAVAYYVKRGDFKSDTSWKWQPWGQFAVAALSLKFFGANTMAARLPFALAGIVTVWLLFRLALKCFGELRTALIAASFLLFNAYWVLHQRQCRYYALSSLFLLLTFWTYLRWQKGERWGAALFVAAGWCWFQVDYGTVWPVLAVLFADALLAPGRRFWRPLMTGAALLLAIAPFARYYELWGRGFVRAGTWYQRFSLGLINLNEYVAPVLVLAAVIVVLARSRILTDDERRVVSLSCAVLVTLALWVPTVAPAPFLRYSIEAAPLGCLVAAWALTRLKNSARGALIWAAAAIFVLTPWFAVPLHVLWPGAQREVTVFRPELKALIARVFGHPADPNAAVIEWLRQNAKPNYEILINYEDIPLMFYLANPIRGGISAFRAEDDAKRPPDFVVLRRSVEFGYWGVYRREMERYQWEPVLLDAPDIKCGNCPDPIAVERKQPGYDPASAQRIYLAQRKEFIPAARKANDPPHANDFLPDTRSAILK